MLEDKTTETRKDEPAAAPRHTGFRAKLRSLWAQLQCVHLLRRHRRYRRRRHRLDNASRKLRSSKLVLRIGAALYALGFGAEYAAVRVGRAVKYAALWVVGAIRSNLSRARKKVRDVYLRTIQERKERRNEP